MKRWHSLRIVLLLVAFGATAAVLPAGAKAPKRVNVSASIVIKRNLFPRGGCSAGAEIEYSPVRGATSYVFEVLDNGRPVTYGAPPFNGESDAFAPKGKHRIGLAGGGGSDGDCSGFVDGYKARFKMKRAYAVYDPKPATISGRVTRRGKGVSGVRIEARGPARRIVETKRNGSYVIHIPKNRDGAYTVRASRRDDAFEPHLATVDVLSGATAQVDFEIPFYLATVGKVVDIKQVKPGALRAEIFRNGRWQPLNVNDDVSLHNQVRTNGNTALALSFDLGGRVYVKPDSGVEILGERSVGDHESKGVKVNKGGVWAQCGQLKESLEISTGVGGPSIMGIKG